MAKTVLITGASSGIGRALAVEFSKRGYALGLCARRLDLLENIQKEISQNHAVITISDGLEKSFYIESPKITGDSVDITIAYFNRLEKYDIEPFSFIANVPEDTLCPEIDNYFKIEDKLVVNFSEPIKFLKKDVFIKDNKKPLYYDVIDPFSASIHIGDISDETIYINNASIVDFSDNVLDSLIAIVP